MSSEIRAHPFLEVEYSSVIKAFPDCAARFKALADSTKGVPHKPSMYCMLSSLNQPTSPISDGVCSCTGPSQ